MRQLFISTLIAGCVAGMMTLYPSSSSAEVFLYSHDGVGNVTSRTPMSRQAAPASLNPITSDSTFLHSQITPTVVVDNLTVELDEMCEGRYTVFGADGQIYLNGTVNIDYRTVVDCSALPTGMFIITIEAGAINESHKFIKQ